MSTAGQVLHATIEVDPVRTLLVLGPQVTALCLSEARSHHQAATGAAAVAASASFLSYESIAESGIRKSLELDSFETAEARERRELLLKNAYELEPAFAMHKVLESLRAHHDSHDGWIKEVFQSSKELQFDGENSRTLQHLLYLRRKGVRIIYTHYDDLLAKALGLPVVLLEEEEGVRKWSQGFPALLHLHGVYTKPRSIRMDCLCYHSVVGSGRIADIIREQFQSRATIFIGYDSQFMDPFLPKIISSFATPRVMPTSLPLFLSLSRKPLPVSGVLPMAVEPSTNLSSLIKISKTPLSVAPINDSSHPVSLQLLCSSKEEVTDIFELLRKSPNLLANLIQRDSNLYMIDLQMNRSVLQGLWLHIFSPAVMASLRELVAIELQGSFVVNFTPQPTPSDEKVRNSPSILTSFAAPPTPTSLWKIPQISTLPHFAISSSLLDQQKQLQLISQTAALNSQQQQFRNHHEKSVRRIQSENDKLTLEDRMDKHTTNGYLIHQQTTPTFSLGTPGFLLGPKGNIPYTLPNPSVFMNVDRKGVSENRVEVVEQTSTKNTVSDSDEREELEEKKDQMSFEDKRNQFIREAQEWSKKVGSKIGPKSNELPTMETQVPMSLHSSINGGVPLVPLNVSGGLCSVSPSSPSLSPKSLFHKPHSGFYLASPQSTNMFSIVPPPTSAIPSIAGTVLASPLSLFTSLPKLSTSDGSNGIVPGLAAAAPDQKFVYMTQEGKFMTTPFMQEAGLKMNSGGFKTNESFRSSPKRVATPNSDPEYSYPPKKRRHSSSLPDVNHLKSSPSPSPSPISPSPTIAPSLVPVDSQPYVTMLGGGNQATPPIFFSNMQLPQQQVGMKMDERQNGEDMSNNLPPSPEVDVTLHPVPPGRGPIQLWQFLLDLLLSSDKNHLIQWTGNGYEFHIVQPEEIAKLWGARKNKPRMNYDKLSRGLRYYYSKGIMDKVPGKKLTFKYTCDIQKYILHRSSNGSSVLPVKSAC